MSSARRDRQAAAAAAGERITRPTCRACRTLRELSGRLLALPGGAASGRRGDLPLRPHRRRHRRRGRREPERAARRAGRVSRRARRDGGRDGRRRRAGRRSSSRWPRHRRHRLPVDTARRAARRLHPGRTGTRYADRAALLDYCRRSANLVGRLLLHLYGVGGAGRWPAPTPSAPPCSSPISGRTWVSTRARGRLYLPGPTARSPRRRPARAARAARTATASIASSPMLVAWARELMLFGRAAGHAVAGPRRLGAAPRGPGRAARARAHRPARRRHLARRPKLGWADAPAIAWRALAMRREIAASAHAA